MEEIYRNLFRTEDNFKGCFISEEISNFVYIPDKSKPYLNAIIVSGKKTGSMSLYKSFRDMGKNCARMTCYDLEYAIKDESLKRKLIDAKTCFVDYCISECHNDDVVLIVTSIRDPLKQKIAEFFFNIHGYTGKRYDEIERECLEEGKLQELIDLFNTKISVLPGPTEHSIIRNAEITSLEFDKDEKYGIYQEKNVIYLFLRVDNIENWEKIISRIPCFEKFKMSRMNIEAEKPYAVLYERFIEKYTIGQDQLDSLYDYYDETLRRYFKDEELIRMREKWMKKK